MRNATLQYDEEALEQLCRRRHVRRLDLFGSLAKGTADADSDLDLLVEYEPEHVPGLIGFLELEEELEDLFEIPDVDLVSRGGISPYLRDDILKTRSLLYDYGERVIRKLRWPE